MRNAFTHHENHSFGPRRGENPDFGGRGQRFGGPRRGEGPMGGRGFDQEFSEDGREFPNHGGHGGRGPFGHRGGPGGFGPEFGGFGGPGFGHDGRGRRGGPGRGRRGDVRAAILALLGDEPMNGYQLIQAIAEKSEGLWKPGAGSVYPALGLLEDEGLIAPDSEGRKKLYSLTPEGVEYAKEHEDELNAPWQRVAGPHSGFLDLRPELAQLGMALNQVAMSGDKEQIEAARGILDKARKDVYRLLAGDMPTE